MFWLLLVSWWCGWWANFSLLILYNRWFRVLCIYYKLMYVLTINIRCREIVRATTNRSNSIGNFFNTNKMPYSFHIANQSLNIEYKMLYRLNITIHSGINSISILSTEAKILIHIARDQFEYSFRCVVICYSRLFGFFFMRQSTFLISPVSVICRCKN